MKHVFTKQQPSLFAQAAAINKQLMKQVFTSRQKTQKSRFTPNTYFPLIQTEVRRQKTYGHHSIQEEGDKKN